MREPIVVIPARHGSRRFPGKPLVPIVGASGEAKPLLRRTWEVGVASGYRTIITTDNEHIAGQAKGWGAEVRMTDYVNVRNGTERCALVAGQLGLRHADVVINLQGDALLTPPEWVRSLAYALRHGDESSTGESVATSVAEASISVGDVVAYTDIYGHAYHFSRVQPHGKVSNKALRHFGLYAYTVGALFEYLGMGEQGPLEVIEDLEQNRWLHLGIPIKAQWDLEGDRLPICEVNEPGDVSRVQEELAKWGIE